MNSNVFVHHVYFWLNNPGSVEDKKALLAGLKKLSAVKTIQFFHIGEPATTNRDVIDVSYSLSWLLFFENKADQDSYQVDPDHLLFVKECSHLWKQVIVYDSVSAVAS
jgi:Stress responsive A/B Barrel Domain